MKSRRYIKHRFLSMSRLDMCMASMVVTHQGLAKNRELQQKTVELYIEI